MLPIGLYTNPEQFAGRSGAKPIGVLDLKYWSLGCLVDPPQPPQWAPGAAHVHRQCLAWSPGRSIFRSFFRFDFGLDFGLVLGPFWARLGRLSAPFWEPKSGQVGPKMVLNHHFFASILDSILDSFWIRFGLVLGSFWTPFGHPNRVKLGLKCVLSRHYFENVDFSRSVVFPRRGPHF